MRGSPRSTWPFVEIDSRQSDATLLVHVWKLDLGCHQSAEAQLRAFISEDEITRAQSYLSAVDGNRFATGRGLLRWVLSRYLGIKPDEVGLEYLPHGKPRLAPLQDSKGLGFNLTHSGSVGLIALGLGSSVGIDVERIREDIDFVSLSQYVFGDSDPNLESSRSRQPRKFFELWTAREAALKMTGLGLAGLHQTHFQPASFFRIDIGEPYVATVALPHKEVRFECFELSEQEKTGSCCKTDLGWVTRIPFPIKYVDPAQLGIQILGDPNNPQERTWV